MPKISANGKFLVNAILIKPCHTNPYDDLKLNQLTNLMHGKVHYV